MNPVSFQRLVDWTATELETILYENDYSQIVLYDFPGDGYPSISVTSAKLNDSIFDTDVENREIYSVLIRAQAKVPQENQINAYAEVNNIVDKIVAYFRTKSRLDDNTEIPGNDRVYIKDASFITEVREDGVVRTGIVLLVFEFTVDAGL